VAICKQDFMSGEKMSFFLINIIYLIIFVNLPLELLFVLFTIKNCLIYPLDGLSGNERNSKKIRYREL